MAMLAEPRKKIKWTLNPRGKLWSEDQNKFGQRMLEKMGWTQGRGLGANEQGITTPIGVRPKSDSKGIGFEGRDSDWCKHQEDFDKVLADLAETIGVTEGNDQPKSLEEISKQSKVRLHYPRFTRGKDLTLYTKKDLDCILGTKAKKKDQPSTCCNIEDVGSVDNSFGVTTIIGGNVEDYLKKKIFPVADGTDGSSAEDVGRKGKRKRLAAGRSCKVMEIEGRVESLCGRKKRMKSKHVKGSNQNQSDGICQGKLSDQSLRRRCVNEVEFIKMSSSPVEEDNFADDENSDPLPMEVQNGHEPVLKKPKKKRRKSKSVEASCSETLLGKFILSDSDNCEGIFQDLVESCVEENNLSPKIDLDLDKEGEVQVFHSKNQPCGHDCCEAEMNDWRKETKESVEIVCIDLVCQDITPKLKNTEISKDKNHKAGIKDTGMKVMDKHVKKKNAEILLLSSSEESPTAGKKCKKMSKKPLLVDLCTSSSSEASTEAAEISCSALPRKIKKKSKKSFCQDSNITDDVVNVVDVSEIAKIQGNIQGIVTIDLTQCEEKFSDERNLPVRKRKCVRKEMAYYRCLNKKKDENTSLSKALQFFRGSNLCVVKGYGSD